MINTLEELHDMFEAMYLDMATRMGAYSLTCRHCHLVEFPTTAVTAEYFKHGWPLHHGEPMTVTRDD